MPPTKLKQSPMKPYPFSMQTNYCVDSSTGRNSWAATNRIIQNVGCERVEIGCTKVSVDTCRREQQFCWQIECSRFGGYIVSLPTDYSLEHPHHSSAMCCSIAKDASFLQLDWSTRNSFHIAWPMLERIFYGKSVYFKEFCNGLRHGMRVLMEYYDAGNNKVCEWKCHWDNEQEIGNESVL